MLVEGRGEVTLEAMVDREWVGEGFRGFHASFLFGSDFSSLFPADDRT